METELFRLSQSPHISLEIRALIRIKLALRRVSWKQYDIKRIMES